MILVDTNVLVYALNEDAPQHGDSRAVVEAALRGALPAVLVPQVLVEAYAVVTDARRVERPLDPSQAWAEMDVLRRGLRVLDLTGAALEALGQLIAARRPPAQEVFEALLVAQMHAHGVSRLCTYDTDDFQGYPGIVVERPPQTLRRAGIRGQDRPR